MNWIVRLILCLAVPQAIGIVGGLATASSVKTWYAELSKPSFNPPGWVFGPVWTLLYAAMGVACYLVWKDGLDKPGVRTALVVYAVQLALNCLWSYLFFYFRAPGPAFVEIIALWGAILATTILFFRLSTLAGVLFLPYLGWVTFAAVLNYSLWSLNR